MTRKRRSKNKNRGGEKSRYGSSRDRKRQQRESREKATGSSYLDLSKYEDVEFFKPKKGTNHIRIIPYEVSVDNNENAEPGYLFWEREIGVVFNVGPEEVAVVPTVAGSKKLRKHLQELVREDIIDEDEAKKHYTKRRLLYNVQDLDSDEPDKILLWDFSFHLFQKQLDAELDENEQYDAYVDLKEGYSIKVRFKEKKFGGNAYLEADRIDFEEAEDLDDDIVDQCYDLDTIVKFTDADELMALIEDEGEPEGEEDEPEEKPKRSRRSRKSSKDEEDEPEDDDDGDSDEDEEPEEEDGGGESSVSKSELQTGWKVVVQEDDGQYEAEVTSVPPKGNKVQVLFDGFEPGEVEMIDVDTIVEFKAPERRRRKKK
jgi:hypothetical protein